VSKRTSDDELKFPLVSVITLVYNTGRYVLESFECVKRQNYPNLQHVIIDDCSTDDSSAVVREWISKNNYECEFIQHTVNKGVQHTLKEAFGLSKGKYFVGISDDLWTDNKLNDQVALLEKAGDAYALVYGDSDMIDKDGKTLIPSMFAHYRGASFVPPSGDIFQEIVKDFYFFIQASLIRLDYFKKMNYAFNKEIISEDWDWQLWLSRNYKILGVKDIYASYRWLDTSVGRANWTDDKVHNVLISQAKMLLSYYDHPKNSKEDKKAIYKRVEKMYFGLLNASNSTPQQKRELLRKIIKTTGGWQLYIRVLKFNLSKKWASKK
jgi:glycosyltransferase involved in cell wall biosynthesis